MQQTLALIKPADPLPTTQAELEATKARWAGELMVVAWYMRQGALRRGQCEGGFFDVDYRSPRKATSCALGAVMEASTGIPVKKITVATLLYLDGTIDADVVIDRFPALALFVKHPVEARYEYDTMYKIIYELNDNHGWTREAIADWIVTVAHSMDFYLTIGDAGKALLTERLQQPI